MAKLSKREREMLEQLQAKAEAPERPSVAKSLSVSINLGNKEEVALAKRYGFLDDDDDDDDDSDDDDDDKDKEDTPRRRGYFGD